MAWEVWSEAANDVVSVDDDEAGITECDCCHEDFDLFEEGGVDDCDAFCGECYREIFGEEPN